MGGWIKVNGWDKNPAGFDTYFNLVAPSDGMYLQQDQLGDGTGDKAAVAFYDGGTIGQADDDILPLNTWTFVFVVCTGSPLTLNVYWGAEAGALSHQVVNGDSLSVTGLTSAYLGSDFFGESSYASFRGIRVWKDQTWDLTSVTAERNSSDFSPVKTAGLYSDIRIPNGTNPHIATNGADWTLVGTFANDTSNPVLAFSEIHLSRHVTFTG